MGKLQTNHHCKGRPASSESNKPEAACSNRWTTRKESNVNQLDLIKEEPPKKLRKVAKEWKIVPLRDCPLPEHLQLCDNAKVAADYWRLHVANSVAYNPECECFIVLLLNTRRRIRGHYLVSIGIMDSILVHPREVFRLALIASANSILLMHNHPSGEATPSEADVRVTRDLIRAGQLLKIEVVDHVIVGKGQHCSLKELGFFYT